MDASRVATALANAYGAILPSKGFKVVVDADRVVVRAVPPSRHAGSVLNGAGVLTLLLPLPKPLRLRVFFENEARALQEFVSKMEHKDWPAPDTAPHVRVTDDEIRVWYGNADENSAPLHWPTLDRKTLGI